MSFTLCSNQRYLHYHYHLYFYPAFINNVTDCFLILIIIIVNIITKINPPFSLSKLLKL